MAVSSKLSTPKAYIITFLKWGLFGLLMGVWGGLYSSQMQIFQKTSTNPLSQDSSQS